MRRGVLRVLDLSSKQLYLTYLYLDVGVVCLLLRVQKAQALRSAGALLERVNSSSALI